jgi:8-oxo-dGTP diphosphatase
MSSVNRVRTVSAFLVNREGKVIAQLRDDKPGLVFPACWSTLGGRVERDETPDEAMQRELLEEIEICPPMTFWRLFEHRYFIGERVYDADIYAYIGEINLAIADIRLHEGQRLAFLDRAEIDRLPFAFGLDHLYREFFEAYGDSISGNL